MAGSGAEYEALSQLDSVRGDFAGGVRRKIDELLFSVYSGCGNSKKAKEIQEEMEGK